MPKSTAKAAAPVTAPAAPSTDPPKPDKELAHAIQYGNVRVSIWKAKSPKGVAFTATIDRFWRNGSGREETDRTFLASDLHCLAKAAAEARRWIEWQQKLLDQNASTIP